jgi:hypothetical protein
MACEFKGRDLMHELQPYNGENCGGKCVSTLNCTHFTWNGTNGGTCWMKYGIVDKSNAIYNANFVSSVCGIIVNKITTDKKRDCDYEFNDKDTYYINNITKLSECDEKCNINLNCTHFIYNHIRKQCFLKSSNNSSSLKKNQFKDSINNCNWTEKNQKIENKSKNNSFIVALILLLIAFVVTTPVFLSILKFILNLS